MLSPSGQLRYPGSYKFRFIVPDQGVRANVSRNIVNKGFKFGVKLKKEFELRTDYSNTKSSE